MSELPLAAVDRVARKAGAERISEPAVILLADILEEEGIKIVQEARLYAKHANRKTITDSDIRLVLRRK